MTTDTRTNIQRQRRDAKGKLLPKIIDTPIKPILDALNDALRSIRNKHPEVPNVVLVVGTSSIKKHGHFSPESWDSKSAQNEVMISGESLKRGAEATLGTLIHECTHALAHARGIKDTSRQGRFHNKRFKALAEELGIEVESDKTIGWSITSLPKTTAALYKPELAALTKALKAYRLPTMAGKAKVKTTIKLATESGRKLTVPIKFYEAGPIMDEATMELFEPVE